MTMPDRDWWEDWRKRWDSVTQERANVARNVEHAFQACYAVPTRQAWDVCQRVRLDQQRVEREYQSVIDEVGGVTWE